MSETRLTSMGDLKPWLPETPTVAPTAAPVAQADPSEFSFCADGDPCLQALVENSRDVLCRLGPDLCVRYISPSARGLFKREPDEMVGRPPSHFVLDEDLPLIAEAAARAAGGDPETPTTVRIRRPDGSVVWVEATASTLRDPHTNLPREIILVMRDVTERQALQARLQREATTDGLTGLANRRAFDETLAREWARTERNDACLSLVLLDIDHFKAFNDRYGHQAGDDCLRAVAEAVQSASKRPGDLTARYGGEELAVVLPATDAQGARRVAEIARANVEALGLRHAASDCGVVTVSVGVATASAGLGEGVRMPEALVVSADGALYRSKRTGRNRVEIAMLMAAKGSRAA